MDAWDVTEKKTKNRDGKEPKPVLAGTTVKNWRTLLEQGFTVCIPLLMATSEFGLGRGC